MTLSGFLVLVALPLVLTEVPPWAGRLAARLLRPAAVLRYGDCPRAAIRIDEWSAHLDEIPGPLSQLAYACGYLGAAAVSACIRLARHLPGPSADLVGGLFVLPVRVDRMHDDQAAEHDDPPWMAFARCAQTDPEAFFSEKGGSVSAAKRVCLSCEVSAKCLQYAIEHDEKFGIWGGLTERERRRLPGPAA
jgi:WhiB family transcriptional regulator, redox-sensing transcriptional regulator